VGSVESFQSGEGGGPPFQAVIWDNGQLSVLPYPDGYAAASGIGINDSGDAIGAVWVTPEQRFPQRMAFWRDGQVSVIGPESFSARALNGRRQIAGCASPDGGNVLAPVIWENDQLRWLPQLGGTGAGCAVRINEAGVAVGNSKGRPVVWQGASVLSLNPPGTTGEAIAVNNRNEIVGSVGGRMFYRPASGPAVWDLGGLIDLAPGQQPYNHRTGRVHDINDKGEILATLTRTIDGVTIWFAVLLGPVLQGGDGQPPTVSLTAPTTGSYVTDRALFQATASDNVGVAGVQFFVNGAAVGPEDTTAPYSFEYDLTPFPDNSVMTFYAKARDASGNVAVTNLKSLVVVNKCYTISRGTWVNDYVGNQTGTFTVTWTESPNGAAAEAGFGVGRGRGIDHRAAAASVVFSADGELKTRHGSALLPSGVHYVNAFYRFRMVVDVVNRRYSVWYRLLNEPEQQLAMDNAFQGTPSVLDFWVASTNQESPSPTQTVCNVKAKAGP